MDPSSKQVYDKLSDLLENLKFGSVTIFVQDGKVAQMEKNEKARVEKAK